MAKLSASFKDLGPILIVVLLASFAYVALRGRQNRNRDRINGMVAKHAKLQRQVNDLERSLAGTRAIAPPMPKTQRLVPTKLGDISFSTPTADRPEVLEQINQWVQMLNPDYLALKSTHKPAQGRSIVLRVVFDAEGNPKSFEYIKAPLKQKLGSALESLIRSQKFPKSEVKTADLAVKLNFDP